MSREIKDKAKEYLKAQLSVIPTKADKTPALITWKEKQSQRIKEEEVESLFSGANVKGLAIICGAISGNLEVIDVDCKYDVTGELWVNIKNLIKLEDITSEVYNSLLIAKTVNNGYHIIYRCDEIEGNQRLAFSVEGDCIIETRGEGGYIIAHPSVGYEFIQGSIEEIPTINPLQRKKLLEIAESLSYVEPTIEEAEGVKLEVTTGLSCWDDYNQKMTTDDVLSLLKAHNWSEVKKDRQGRVYVLRPENVEPSTAKYSGNISRIKKGETEISLFSVFTDNGAPFTENVMLDGKPVKNKNGKFKKQAYTPFAVYTLLEHKGDYSKSAKELYRLGYGDRLSEKEEVNTTNIKVEIVNRVTGETLVISEIGESLKKTEVNSATGEEVLITSPGLEAQEEVLKAIALIQQTGKRIYIKEGDTEVREYRYQLRAIINKYGTIQEESGELTDRDMDSFLDEVVILSSKLNPIDRDIFKTDFLGQEAIKELGISEESLSITVDRLTSTRDKEAQAKDLKKLLSEVTQLHDKGEVNKALELLDNTVKDVKLKDKKSSFNKLLEIPTEEDIKLHFSQQSDSLRSSIYINNHELLLPSGGLTGIAGATGHGKTDFLINLTLNSVLNYPDKEFYFFTYEMSQEAILVRFLNTYLDIDLESYSNQRAIKTYFKTDSTQYIKAEVRDYFTAKVKEFFKDIIGSGRLRIKGIEYTAPELNLALYELSKRENVGGFFIDYFQLLNIPKEGYKNYSRQEELKVICQDLNNTAKQLQLPIILGAQFNREVTTPFKLHPTNISEAGDIERILDTLIGIWFTNKKIVAKDLTKAEENDFKNKGLDTPDKLYTYVLKAREIPTDTYELLDYNGKRGKIKNSNSSGSSYFQ
jgi:replicative DNA helicase